MSDFDPYQSPEQPSATTLDTTAIVELVKGWEKLRLIYNAIMILPGLAVLAMWNIRMDSPVPFVIFSGIVVGISANIAFFLGPLAELYFRAFFRSGAPVGGIRKLIFLGGLAISAMVILLALLTPITFGQ